MHDQYSHYVSVNALAHRSRALSNAITTYDQYNSYVLTLASTHAIIMYDHVGILVRSVQRLLCHRVNLYASTNIAVCHVR